MLKVLGGMGSRDQGRKGGGAARRKAIGHDVDQEVGEHRLVGFFERRRGARDRRGVVLHAPGNYSATSVNSRFVVNSLGLGTLVSAAIYELNTTVTPAAVSTLATFNSSWMASSGVSAATSNGVLVLGYFGAVDFKNHLLVVAPSTYSAPLAYGTSFSLSTALEIYADVDVLNAVGFKDGVALQRGGFPPPTYDPVTTDVTRIPLTLTGSGTQTVTAGAPQTVITAPNQCTSIDFVSHLGDDLLIAVSDRNGRRLVRLVKP